MRLVSNSEGLNSVFLRDETKSPREWLKRLLIGEFRSWRPATLTLENLASKYSVERYLKSCSGISCKNDNSLSLLDKSSQLWESLISA